MIIPYSVIIVVLIIVGGIGDYRSRRSITCSSL